MRVSYLVIAAFMSLSASVPVMAACADDASLIAMRTRMMVSALACTGKADYNTMVRKHRSSLNAAQHRVALSIRSSGSLTYDAWTTELANQIGLERAEAGDGYCPGALIELHEAARLVNTASLHAMSDRIRVSYPAIEGCR